MESKFWKDKKVLITGFEGFLGSNLSRALISLGALKAETNDYQGARSCWQKALAADPSNKAAKQNLERLAAMGF